MKKLLSFLIAIGIALTLIPNNLVKADGEYEVIIDTSIENGLVRTYKDSYNAGEKVYGQYKAKDGYYVDEIYYNGNPVGLNFNSNGDFSFTMPSENVLITADVEEEYPVYEVATGIFGVEYTKMINNIATILDMSPKDLETSINNWLSKTYKTEQDIVVTKDEGGTDDFATNIAINFLVLNFELKVGDTITNEKNDEMEVKKCFLNSDVIFKAYAKLYDFIKKNQNSVLNDYHMIMDIFKTPMIEEFKRCEALKGQNEVCPVTLLRKELTDAKQNPGKPDAPTSNYETLKSNVTNLYNMILEEGKEPKTSEEIDKIIENSLNILAEKGEDIIEDTTFLEANPDVIFVLGSIPISKTAINNYSLLNCYLTDRLYSQDFYMTFLNSDVLFKTMAKLIDACQSKDFKTVCITILTLFSQIKNEEISVYKHEYGSFDEDYVKFIIKKCFTKHEVINNAPIDSSSFNGGFIEILDNPENNNKKTMVMNTSLVRLRALPVSSELTVLYKDSTGVHVIPLDSDGYGKFIMPNEDVNLYVYVSKEKPVVDQSCEKVIGPTWHWNNTKGVCEEVGVVGTSTR